MEIKLVRFIILPLTCLLAACSDDDCSFDIAGDQLRLADSTEIGNKTYYLYTRTTGWNDKVVFFELYDTKPAFDACTYQPDKKALYAIHFDSFPDQPEIETKYVKEMILQPSQPEKLKIVYTKNKGEGTANVYDVKFTR